MQAGYTLDERSIARDEYRRELESLGFTFIPVVVIDGTAMSAFPEGPLRQRLGLPTAEVSAERAQQRIRGTLFCLRVLLSVVPHIPNTMWPVQLVTERDRPLGMWVWHIFALVQEWTTEPATALTADRLRVLAERRYWRDEERFRTFDEIAKYGRQVTSDLEGWTERELGLALDLVISSTPWGTLTMLDVLDQLERHTAVHLRQVLSLLREKDPAAPWLPAEDVMDQIPHFETLARD